MKNARKLISAVMALAMAAAFAPMSAFADSEPTTVKQDSASNTGAMTATYDAQPSYTVTIPASAKIADDAQNAVAQSITAENVLLDKGMKLVVTLTSAENTKTANAETFNAKNGDSTVNYNIFDGENKIALGSNVAEFQNKKEAQSVDLKFVKEANSTPTVAGTHTETLTFGISVENADMTKTFRLAGIAANMMPHGPMEITYDFEIEYTDDDTWGDIAAKYDELEVEGGFIILTAGHNELRHDASTNENQRVSSTDKVSDYSIDGYFIM